MQDPLSFHVQQRSIGELTDPLHFRLDYRRCCLDARRHQLMGLSPFQHYLTAAATEDVTFPQAPTISMDSESGAAATVIEQPIDSGDSAASQQALALGWRSHDSWRWQVTLLWLFYTNQFIKF